MQAHQCIAKIVSGNNSKIHLAVDAHGNLTPAVNSVQLNLGDFSYAA